jgi:hypothetical protein
VIGVRGSASAKSRALAYDLFAGTPIYKPSGFPTARVTAGFQLTAQASCRSNPVKREGHAEARAAHLPIHGAADARRPTGGMGVASLAGRHRRPCGRAAVAEAARVRL